MNKREFLQLANKFVQGKHNPAGMYVSEKLDGSRVFWDGGISRGIPTVMVPWANIRHPKTGELKDKIKPVSTGLWSRYGNPVMAPDWWLNQLPQMFLDGELWAGRQNFQTLRSIVARDVPGDEWRDVRFAVFGTPSPNQVFTSGEINNSNFKATITKEVMIDFLVNRDEAGVMEEFYHNPGLTFEGEVHLLQVSLPVLDNSVVYFHPHYKLPNNRSEAEKKIEIMADRVADEGGEGLMLRDPNSIWTPKRVNTLLKVKPFADDSGILVGFVTGRETDKGSKLQGMIGALILSYKGKRLELSGLTNEERRFETEEQTAWAYNNPGQIAPPDFQGKHFKVGSEVEFIYRELSDDGIPKEARYHRNV